MAKPKIGYASIIETASTLTATSSATGYPIANIKDRRVWNPWKATSTAQQDIDIDMGAAAHADYIAIAGHNLAAENVTLTLYAEGVTPPTVSKAVIAPGDYPASGVYLKEFTDPNVRYWRVRLSAAATNAVYVGAIYLGSILTLPEYLAAAVDPNVEEVEDSIERGETGHVLGTVTRRIVREFNLDLGPAGVEWTDLTGFNTFWRTHARKGYPFFFHPNIDAATTFDATFMIAKPSARLDRAIVGGRYSRRMVSMAMTSALGETP